ncbi:MAG: DUF362 domain-containing protein [Acidobacteriia bacterium]|nr:DUF362 domain-containing protein [Terriglobia bacterium]
MPSLFSRRTLLQWAALSPASRPLLAQTAVPGERRPVVSLVKGESRRKNVSAALAAIDGEIGPRLKNRKSVVIKPNFVSTTNQLAASHAEAIQGILDYLEPRFRGPVFIAESSAGDTMDAFDSFGYNRLAAERRAQHVELVDLNREGKYEIISVLDSDLHAAPVRLAARLLDPDAFVIGAAVAKTHNAMVATLSVKNMALGAPLHSAPRQSPPWHDKRVVHNRLRQTHFNIFLVAQALRPHWGATVIDAYEGMEGDGPASGTAVPARLALASTDFVAADRVALETMGIDPAWVGYLRFCADLGIGQYDLAKIDLRGETLARVRRKYQLHPDIQRQLEWMGPLREVPPRVG